MAKASTKTQTPKDETKKEDVAATTVKKSFDFEIEEGLEIPANVARAPSDVELPFRRKFDAMPKHGQSFFIPTSFWTTPKEEGGRGVEPEKANSAYVRAKVRGAFNVWKKADEEARANRDILMVPRAKGDNAGNDRTFPEDGFTVFMVIK